VRKPHINRGNGRPRGAIDRYGIARKVQPHIVGVVVNAFAEQLKYVREHHDVSASELAAAVGIDVRTIHSYESGRVIPPLAKIVAISLALGVPIEHLVPEV